MSTFNASAKYNDFKGSVAADRSDNASIDDHLRAMGLATSAEHVVAFRIASSAVSGNPVTSVSLVAYLSSAQTFEAAPQSLRAVEISLPPGEALAFFKRFDLVAQPGNRNLSATQVI